MIHDELAGLGEQLRGLLVVRHGERYDEVEEEKWTHYVTSRPHNRPMRDVHADPPLTVRGLDQALKAALTIHNTSTRYDSFRALTSRMSSILPI